MERLNCNELIRRIILSCTSYDCKKRPRAFEMLQQTITIRKMYEQLSPLLPFKPTNDENLVEPSSPIGIKAKIDENYYLITDIEKSEAVKIAEMLASRILFPEQELENVKSECQEKAETFVFTNKRPLCFDYLDFDANLRFDQIISYFEGLISQEQDLLIKLQELSNFVDLARAISSAGVLLMLISSLECPNAISKRTKYMSYPIIR
ncbi:unnamed protein product, partial [Mesorhabditis belari]|uniref:Uncharacterized protein n=1 Tax=Mesorhabditis belari TaxID=2138241 RepID=A0AAF3FGF5_9BILA